MAFPDPETVTVTEHSREINQPIRQYEGPVTVLTIPSDTLSITVTEHERYYATYFREGSGGNDECPETDDRPDTGMLYPRG